MRILLVALLGSAAAHAAVPRPSVPAGGPAAPPVQLLVPGFAVRALPLELPNLNAVRYRADGKLVALAFNGTVYLLADTDGDGLEDRADVFYSPGRQHLSLNLALTPPGYAHGNGVFIARHGGLVLEIDTDGDDRADKEIVVAGNWETPMRYPGGASDAIGVALDADHNVYFGLGAANSQNGYLLENGVASYRRGSERGAMLKVAPDFSRREVVATGIRAAFGLAFNAAGDLFATDQEGATWMANGNPFDELLHLQPGRHYGFPPRHPRHLPDVIDEPSVVDYGPQHQSACGLAFNEPVNGGPVFGPAWWRGDAFVAGESRGKIYRTKLVRTPSGYVGHTQIVAALSWLTIDQCVSPRGDLVITAHSGPPDWGTGARGTGRLFKVSPRAPASPSPVAAYRAGPGELRVAFDRPLPAAALKELAARLTVTEGPYVREGDRFESFRPGYRVVTRQQAAPREKIPVLAARVAADGATVVIETPARRAAQPLSIEFEAWPRAGAPLAGELRQEPVVSLGADGGGVAAAWASADGRDAWSGWLPHFDLQVARELTAASAEHAPLWEKLHRPGTLTLRGQLDLWRMLRPAVQQGERLDFMLPEEQVTVSFSAGGAAPRLTLPGSAAALARVEDAGTTVRVAGHRARERAWLPVELALPTGGAEPRLHVSWTTAEDARPRALALRRVLAPWAAPAGEVAIPASPQELAAGDWHKGKQLYALCAPCHELRGEGSRVGPDLSNLVYRDHVAVLKDIADPNASLQPDHLAYVITRANGDTLTAVVLEDRPDHVLLAVPGAAPLKLPKREIATMTASPVSLMPTGLDTALGPQGVKDLLAYLMLPSPPAPAGKPAAPLSTNPSPNP